MGWQGLLRQRRAKPEDDAQVLLGLVRLQLWAGEGSVNSSVGAGNAMQSLVVS